MREGTAVYFLLLAPMTIVTARTRMSPASTARKDPLSESVGGWLPLVRFTGTFSSMDQSHFSLNMGSS